MLDAGIDVWTTLNVQHLESLNDLVARITDVTVRETVPDRLLERADEVEFIDLPPEELLERLREGKVYVPEQAQRAERSFFRRGNLTALRELALRRTADHVDEDVRDYRRHHAIEETWPVAERLLVCIRPNPESGRLIRSARRLAGRLRAEWIVAFVESPSQPALSAAERASLGGRLQAGGGAGRRHRRAVRRGGARRARLRAPAQRERRGGGQAHASRALGPPARVARRRDRPVVGRDRRLRRLERPRGGGVSGAAAAPQRAVPQPPVRLRLVGAGRGADHPGRPDRPRPARQQQHHHAVPAGRRLRGHALRALAIGADRGLERRRLRLLLRATRT